MIVEPNARYEADYLVSENISASADILSAQLTVDSAAEKERWTIPEAAVYDRLQTHTGPVIVDLDETLYLRNSTKEFIGLAVPGVVAAYLLRLLEIVAPWRQMGGPRCRDNWRVAFILCVFPWTYFRWKKYCQRKVPTFINTKLRDALLAQPNPVIIASKGYEVLLRPMIAAFDLPNVSLISCHLLRFNHRRDGKLILVNTAHGKALASQSLVITDSYGDADLLRACKSPCLVVWNDALFKRAFAGLVYLPGDYLNRVKRPNQGALRSLVLYDLIPWVLIGLTVTSTLFDVLGLVALFFSMWAVYEIGYFTNDQCAVKYEGDPKLTADAQAFDSRFFELKAWTTALAFGAFGVWLLQPAAFLLFSSIWIGVLVALYGSFWIYNRIDKSSRVWLYPVLQMFRFGALFFVVAGGPVGFAAALAQLFSRWTNYIIYRYQRSLGLKNWPKTSIDTIRFVAYIILLIPIALAQQWEAFYSPASICLIIFAYAVWKYDRKTHKQNFKRLDKIAYQAPEQDKGA